MTGRARALLLTTAVAIASNCYAQDLKSYRQKYDDGLQKIVADHQQRTRDITKAYATGLNSLKARVQAAGDLDKLKSVMEEISRFQMAKTLPTVEDKPISEVLALVKDCQTNTEKADTARAKRIVSLASQYDKALLRLQREHTRKGELDKATAIQDERKALAEGDTLTSARSSLVPDKSAQQEARALSQKPIASTPTSVGRQPNWPYLARVFTKKTYSAAKHAGGAGGGKYEDIPAKPGILVGFDLVFNQFKGFRTVRGVRPIFLTADGLSEGSFHGTANRSDVKRVVAKDGYAVGAIDCAFDRTANRRLKVTFMKLSTDGLALKDSYETEWFGEFERTETKELRSSGGYVVGISGSAGAGLDSIGLVEAKSNP